ncbi:MAG: heme exporter protein CcmD [Gammaproteobacteria bacterium]|nr:heme exporter protein CcmD [Gammaproteobacteria bacterium]
MAEFFEMGGHGFFIWTSYAVTALVLLHGYLAPVLRRKNLIRQLGSPDRGPGTK